MAMAALHLLPKNTGRKMHPTISHVFKTSLSPSLPSFCSFPLFPLKCQSTTVAGLNIIKCFHQQNKWSKGSGGIPPTPTPRQLTNIEAYLFIRGQSIKQMVQGIRGYFSGSSDSDSDSDSDPDPDSDFSLDDDLEDPQPKRRKRHPQPKRRKRGQGIRDTNHEPEEKRQKLDDIGLEIMRDGEYVVKIERGRSSTGGSSSTHDEEGDEVERAKRMAQNAAMLIPGELLQDMGKKLLAQTLASLRSIYGIGMPAAPPSDL